MGILDTSMTITIGGVKCSDEGLKYNFSRQTATATRILRCAWADFPKLNTALFGFVSIIGNVTTIIPTQTAPNYPQLVLDTVQVDGEGAKSIDASNTIAFERAVLNCGYRTIDIDTSNTISTTSMNVATQIYVPPTGALKFASDGLALGVGSGVSVQVTSIRRTRRNLIRIPTATILNAAANPLNTSIVDFGPGAISGLAKTIRFDGANTTRYTGLGGTTFDMELCFTIRGATPWDQFMRSDTGQFATVVRQDGSALYGQSDLNLLFTAWN